MVLILKIKQINTTTWYKKKHLKYQHSKKLEVNECYYKLNCVPQKFICEIISLSVSAPLT